jgi:hypothetical protein
VRRAPRAIHRTSAAGREVLQQVAAIDLDRLADRVHRRRADQLLECARIDFHRLAVEAHRRAVVDEDVVRQVAQRVMQVAHDLPHFPLGGRIIEEQRRHLRHRRLARNADGEIDDQRLRTTVPHRQRVASIVDGRQLTEQTDGEEDHFGRQKFSTYWGAGIEN